MRDVLLDTNFIINLLNEKSEHNAGAVNCFDYFLKEGIKMYLSAVAIEEYCVKGNFNELPIDKVMLLDYNTSHAILAGKLASIIYSSKRPAKSERLIVNNDIKLLAQAQSLNGDAQVSFVEAKSGDVAAQH